MQVQVQVAPTWRVVGLTMALQWELAMHLMWRWRQEARCSSTSPRAITWWQVAGLR